MKAKLIAFAALLCMLFSCVTAAADDYSPLQAADAGNWYDPAQSGSGFDILPYPVPHSDGYAFVTFYASGSDTTPPTWYAAQPAWSGAGTVTADLYASTKYGSFVVGSASFTAKGATCSSIAAEVTVTGSPARHFDLVPLIQPNAAQCHVCSGYQFSPMPPGC